MYLIAMSTPIRILRTVQSDHLMSTFQYNNEHNQDNIIV